MGFGVWVRPTSCEEGLLELRSERGRPSPSAPGLSGCLAAGESPKQEGNWCQKNWGEAGVGRAQNEGMGGGPERPGPHSFQGRI